MVNKTKGQRGFFHECLWKECNSVAFYQNIMKRDSKTDKTAPTDQQSVLINYWSIDTDCAVADTD